MDYEIKITLNDNLFEVKIESEKNESPRNKKKKSPPKKEKPGLI